MRKAFIERKRVMKTFWGSLLLWALFSFISPVGAESLKTSVIEMPDSDQAPVSQATVSQAAEDKITVRQPTDDELDLANEMLDLQIDVITRVKPNGLFGIKKDDSILILKKKGASDVEPGKVIVSPEAVQCEPEDAKKLQDNLNGLYDFLKNSELMLGLGGAFGLSPKLAKEYYPGFDATFGYGYKLSPTFSLLLDGEAVRSGSAEDSVTGGYNFTAGGLSLLAKLRFATKGLRPYLFAGPGICTINYNYIWQKDNYTQNMSYSDDGFMLEGGVGVEIQVDKVIYLFFQDRMVWSTTTSGLNNFVPTDNPVGYMPLEFGVMFGR